MRDAGSEGAREMNARMDSASRNSRSSLKLRAKDGQARRRLAILMAVFFIASAANFAQIAPAQKQAGQDDFYPEWAAQARYLQPLWVVDTDSALGRRNLHPKSITLEDMARMHGHLCDGLVTSWVELSAALRQLFPDGVVDRTDVRAVSRNCPCCVDAAAWMTGARINQGTLMLDNSIGVGFFVQRISTGEAVRVSLRPGLYPAQLTALEQSIRSSRARGEAVAPTEIDLFERGANKYSRKLLNTPPDQVVIVERITNYHFPNHSENPLAPRSDIINRDAPRSSQQAKVNQQR
jgi:formylmethanofuran dehydrogenase subunit E